MDFIFKEIFMDTIARNIKNLRLKNGISQQSLANGTGISLRAIQNYEQAQREPKATQLIALADFFDVSLDYLVGRSDER